MKLIRNALYACMLGACSLSLTASAEDTMMYPFAEDDVQLVAADYLQRLEYKDYTRDTFWLSQNPVDAPIKLELRRAIKLAPDTFMLKFRTRDLQVLPQKTYKLDHDELGPMALFFTSARNSKGTRTFYNAIINKMD